MSGADRRHRRALAGLAPIVAVALFAAVAYAPARAETSVPDDGAAAAASLMEPVSPDDAERQAQLVAGEDQRLLGVRVAGAAQQITYPLRPYRVRLTGFSTLVLPARRAPYTLDDLRILAPQTFLLQRDGSFLLREHILVGSGATLALAPSRPLTIRLASGPSGFVSIVASGGGIRLLGSAAAPLTFVSWDETNNQEDTKVNDGRAYLLAMGRLVARYANFRHLGFWSGRTGGVAIASSQSAGVDPSSQDQDGAGRQGSSTDARQAEVVPAGPTRAAESTIEAVVAELSNVHVTGDAFGLFVTGASGAKISNVTVADSLVDGLVLHRNVSNAQVQQVRVQGSHLDGLVLTRGVEGALLSQVTSTGNARDGIVITGTPLATGPSPGGSSTRQFGNNVVTTSLAQNNGRTGIRINGGTKLRLLGNSVVGGEQGVLVSHGADKVAVDANRLVDVHGNAVQVRESTNVEVSGNAIRRAEVGVHATDSAVQLTDNTIGGATLHAVALVGTAKGSVVKDNSLGGRGSSAVDTARMDGASRPAIGPNDTGNWQRIITSDGLLSTASHPLTIVWMAIAITLAASQVMIYRQRHRRGVRAPYRDGPPKPESVIAIEADQMAALRRFDLVRGPAPRDGQPVGVPAQGAAGVGLLDPPVKRSPPHTAPSGIGLPASPTPESRRGRRREPWEAPPRRPPTAEDNAAWLRRMAFDE